MWWLRFRGWLWPWACEWACEWEWELVAELLAAVLVLLLLAALLAEAAVAAEEEEEEELRPPAPAAVVLGREGIASKETDAGRPMGVTAAGQQAVHAGSKAKDGRAFGFLWVAD